ncbi:hypothetical protein GGS24DRAFT_477390 [Hypoxylon argillaceum]|nr:hypothetical protein GGS24DRAFT_477390 [Hypoxylon argillaceum]
MSSAPSTSTQFPAFYELPPASSSDPSAADGSAEASWWLLAQIKENMTLTQPTLIATDTTGVDFALLFEDARFSLRGFRKGFTVVVPGARRTDRGGEGKKAVVRVPARRGADVKVIPGSLERVSELGVVLQGGDAGRKCAACGKAEGAFLKCTGCGFAAYCGKDCQVKGWSEMGHKSNCKVIKALREISL